MDSILVNGKPIDRDAFANECAGRVHNSRFGRVCDAHWLESLENDYRYTYLEENDNENV